MTRNDRKIYKGEDLKVSMNKSTNQSRHADESSGAKMSAKVLVELSPDSTEKITISKKQLYDIAKGATLKEQKYWITQGKVLKMQTNFLVNLNKDLQEGLKKVEKMEREIRAFTMPRYFPVFPDPKGTPQEVRAFYANGGKWEDVDDV